MEQKNIVAGSKNSFYVFLSVLVLLMNWTNNNTLRGDVRV